MQMLTKWASDLSLEDPMLWGALGVGLVVVLCFLLLGRRPKKPLPDVVPANPETDLAPPPVNRNEERRQTVRRSGVPSPLLIADDKGKLLKGESFVLDRSSGGIKLGISKSLAVGTILNVRPSNAPDSFQWVRIIVRSCREVGDYYELGCQFERELDWSSLLMFG